jgi:hypothetical protein
MFVGRIDSHSHWAIHIMQKHALEYENDPGTLIPGSFSKVY